MEHKKDIGDLLKDRLNNAQKAPSKTLWERLDNSLDKREKKRRSIIWFWYGGAGVFLALLLLAGVLATPSSTSLDGNTSEISTEENRTKMNNKTETEIKTSLNNKVVTQDGTEIIVSNEGTNITTPDTSGADTTTPVSKATQKIVDKTNTTPSKAPVTEDGFTVITTHEYYNSDLDTTTTSHNKQKIDSLVAANRRVMASKDSIARKRATDSIKLNEARKDSIRE
ncbi:hypothetical protein [Rasiella sp. SM2506]|uniref:hypothetical protein n=1 Tax=Rasiella sp. SM2506 TaxID=3423914 RepID=UPI003D7BD95B